MAVVIDVLSFTTTLSVALDVGIAVLPYRFGGDHAVAYADENDAVLAVGRSAARGDQISLSSTTIRDRAQHPERLVLPSPNGSTICYELANSSTTVIGACLRNADIVGAWICATHPPGANIAVIAAGEQWPDGSLRPAFEDIWGAGAVLTSMAAHGWPQTTFSPEARAAGAAWTSVEPAISSQLVACASGQELIDAGYPRDVTIAGETNSSSIVPVLRTDRFVPAY